jgi:hypothetical protein
MSENRGRPKENVEKKMKYVVEFEDSRWHYDLNKYPNGPYLVEQLDTTYNKLEKLYYKLEKLKAPKHHENGRKKRITKSDKQKISNIEKAYWAEHYKLFPNERPKRRGRKPSK